MQKNIAISLITLSKSMDNVIGRMYDEVAKIEDEDMRAEFRRAVGDIMGYISRDIIFPIEKLYPDLAAD